MRDLDELFAALRRSPFRSRQQLSARDVLLLQRKTRVQILTHAEQIVRQRLAPAAPVNDGKQTPWQGHPVFTAQHATATCCRRCLAKWHQIPIGQELTSDQVAYIVEVLRRWMDESGDKPFGALPTTHERTLFDSHEP